MKKTIFLAEGRCGSQLVIRSLERHSKISVIGEILNDNVPEIPDHKLVKELFGITLVGKRLGKEVRDKISKPIYIDRMLEQADIFKILYHHLDPYPELLEHLQNKHVVRLERKNHLARMVSERISSQLGVWHLRNDKKDVEYEQIIIEPKELINFCIYMNRVIDKMGSYFDCPIFYYEDIIKNKDNFFRQIQEIIEIDYEELKPKTKKLIKKPVSLVVENFGELEETFRGTKYEKYIEMSRYHFTDDWFSCNIPVWNEFLKGKKNLNCLEIGSYEGRSAIWVLENCPNSFITMIEPGYSSPINILWDNMEAGGFQDRSFILESESSILNTHHGGLENPYLDFIYIDGCHKEKSVWMDAENAFRLLKVGGLICFDDYLWVEEEDRPKPAIGRFLDVYRDKIQLVHRGYQVWVRKL